jgi:hypothetical protein
VDSRAIPMSGPRPTPANVLRMARAMTHGSAIDAPKSLLGVIREMPTDTPRDSPLTMKQLLRRDDYRELMTPKVAPGEPAFDFELPCHDFSSGVGITTGTTMRLSAFRGVEPVALIFGSYT